MRKHKVFVYGTLKRGYGNHRLIAEGKGEFVGLDAAPGALYGGHGFPFVKPVKQRRGNWVGGEVWAVDDATLARLDGLEGHPRFYIRTRVRMRSRRMASIYYYPHSLPESHRIPMRNGVPAVWAPRSEVRGEQVD